METSSKFDSTICPIDIEPTSEYINEYGFPSMVQVHEYGSHTRDLFRSRFPSTDPGSRVQIQVSKYGFWLAQYWWDIRYIPQRGLELPVILSIHLKPAGNLHSWFLRVSGQSLIDGPCGRHSFLINRGQNIH